MLDSVSVAVPVKVGVLSLVGSGVSAVMFTNGGVVSPVVGSAVRLSSVTSPELKA